MTVICPECGNPPDHPGIALVGPFDLRGPNGDPCEHPIHGSTVMARRPTLDVAPLLVTPVEGVARGTGYQVAVGGSVLYEGRGRDLDVYLLPRPVGPQAPLEAVRAELGRVLGREVVPWQDDGRFHGAVYQWEGFLLDVTVIS